MEQVAALLCIFGSKICIMHLNQHYQKPVYIGKSQAIKVLLLSIEGSSLLVGVLK